MQCDFNSPFYEENECGWKYIQRLLTTLGIGSSKRLIRSRFETATATPMNYFQRKNTLFGNYWILEPNQYKYIKLYGSVNKLLPKHNIGNILDNFVLRGNDENSRYAIVSSIQLEKGPRLLFPHFGFHYRAKNTRVRVIFLETASNTQHDIMDSMVNTLTDEIETENEWKYFFKNITEESFISSAWAGSTEVEWQVNLKNVVCLLNTAHHY